MEGSRWKKILFFVVALVAAGISVGSALAARLGIHFGALSFGAKTEIAQSNICEVETSPDGHTTFISCGGFIN